MSSCCGLFYFFFTTTTTTAQRDDDTHRDSARYPAARERNTCCCCCGGGAALQSSGRGHVFKRIIHFLYNNDFEKIPSVRRHRHRRLTNPGTARDTDVAVLPTRSFSACRRRRLWGGDKGKRFPADVGKFPFPPRPRRCLLIGGCNALSRPRPTLRAQDTVYPSARKQQVCGAPNARERLLPSAGTFFVPVHSPSRALTAAVLSLALSLSSVYLYSQRRRRRRSTDR